LVDLKRPFVAGSIPALTTTLS